MKTHRAFNVKKLLITIILAVAVLLICALQLPFSLFIKTGEGNYNNVLRIANSGNASFGNTPITEIALLGSHDALAYGINFSSPSNTNEENVCNNFFVKTLAKG